MKIEARFHLKHLDKLVTMGGSSRFPIFLTLVYIVEFVLMLANGNSRSHQLCFSGDGNHFAQQVEKR